MLTLRLSLTFFLATLFVTTRCYATNGPFDVARVKVTGCTVDSAHINALAETLNAARAVYLEWGFNMPDVVNLSITCKEGAQTNLFTDGVDHLFLTIPSQDVLAPPAKSGTFNIYGMCHELGHIAMYRILKNMDWMTDAAAEGWAHYIGSVVVDRVFAMKGDSLWPERYDYRADGTARLQKDIASKTPSDLAIAAAQWQKLGAIIGEGAFPRLFAAWQSAGSESPRPWETWLPALQRLKPQNEAALNHWWEEAAPILTKVSGFRTEQVAPSELSGHMVKVPAEAGSETNRMSLGGGGEGRKFTIPDANDQYITAVWVYGSRYGDEKAPNTSFDIALSDADANLVSIWKAPYASFTNEQDGWVRFAIPPTRVPNTFFVTLNFRADASNGVYVGFDSSTKGNSFDSLPGKTLHEFSQGDWMVRVELDHKK
jgi:hypothetical protein